MNHKSFSQNPIFLKPNDVAQFFIEVHPEAQRLRSIIQLKIKISNPAQYCFTIINNIKDSN